MYFLDSLYLLFFCFSIFDFYVNKRKKNKTIRDVSVTVIINIMLSFRCGGEGLPFPRPLAYKTFVSS